MQEYAIKNRGFHFKNFKVILVFKTMLSKVTLIFLFNVPLKTL